MSPFHGVNFGIFIDLSFAFLIRTSRRGFNTLFVKLFVKKALRDHRGMTWENELIQIVVPRKELFDLHLRGFEYTFAEVIDDRVSFVREH